MEAAAQGSRIRLISKSQIRYEGTLSEIDPAANTVSLKNVRMYGTENRAADRTIPPSDALYDFIVFRGSDIKDLTVFEDDKRKQHDFVDPAVVTAQQSRRGYQQDRNQSRNFNQKNQHNFDQWGGGNKVDYYNRRDNNKNRMEYRGMGGKSHNRDHGPHGHGLGHGQHGGHGGAMGHGRPGAHGHGEGGHGARNRGVRQFDRRQRDQSTNLHTGTNFKAKNEEEAKEKRKTAGVEEEFNFGDKTIDKDKVKEEANKEEIKAEKGYDKKKSFFDSLSCETTERSNTEQGSNKLSKEQREKLRKYDIDTFGAEAVTAIERSFHGNRKRGQGRGGHGRGGSNNNNNNNNRHQHRRFHNNNATAGNSGRGRGGIGGRGRRW